MNVTSLSRKGPDRPQPQATAPQNFKQFRLDLQYALPCPQGVGFRAVFSDRLLLVLQAGDHRVDRQEEQMRETGVRLGRFAAASVASVCFVVAVGACGSSNSKSSISASGASSSGGVAGKHVFVVSRSPADPYCASYNSILEKDLRAKGLQVNLVTNPKSSGLEEQELAQGISQNPNVIVNLPTDSFAVAAGYSKARSANIPVISTVNPVSPTAASVTTSQVYDNNYEIGRIAAQNIQAGLAKRGLKTANVIAITGNAASLTTTQRVTVFKAQLAKTPQYRLVAVQDGNWASD